MRAVQTDGFERSVHVGAWISSSRMMGGSYKLIDNTKLLIKY